MRDWTPERWEAEQSAEHHLNLTGQRDGRALSVTPDGVRHFGEYSAPSYLEFWNKVRGEVQ